MEIRFENELMDRGWLFDPRLNPWFRALDRTPRHMTPPVDVTEDKGAYHFYFEMPGLNHESIDARVEDGKPLACAASAQRRHPVVGLWPASLRADLRHALLSEGVRKVDSWTAQHGIAIATWPATPVDPFFNVNTAEDAAEANRIAAQLQKSETQ